jgi:hypothetical protein
VVQAQGALLVVARLRQRAQLRLQLVQAVQPVA